MLSRQPKGKTMMVDETLMLLRRQVSERIVVPLRIVAGFAEIFDIHVAVAAAGTAHPHDWSRRWRRSHTGGCIHRVATMSWLCGQNAGSSESEDRKTDENTFGHDQLL
jgi:hypothetical protein